MIRTNGDKLREILGKAVCDESISYTTRELIQFILDGDNTDETDDHISRVTSLMVICQAIFVNHPSALLKMNEQVAGILLNRKQD